MATIDKIKYYLLIAVCLVFGARFFYLMFTYPELTEAQRLIMFWPEYLISFVVIVGLSKLVFK